MKESLARELRCNPKLICADLEPVNPLGLRTFFIVVTLKKYLSDTQ